MQEISERKRKRGAYKMDSDKRDKLVSTKFTESELALINEANTEQLALATFIVQTVLGSIKKPINYFNFMYIDYNFLRSIILDRLDCTSITKPDVLFTVLPLYGKGEVISIEITLVDVIKMKVINKINVTINNSDSLSIYDLADFFIYELGFSNSVKRN